MFQKIVPLNLDTHRNLRFDAKQNYEFAAKLRVSPVMSAEAGHIAREYVLVFARQSESLPLALLGLEQDKNAYVSANGEWQSRYIPAHIRRYPFMLADSAENPAEAGNRRFTMMIDTDAPHFSATTGEPLFDEQGGPGDVLKRVQEALSNLQHDQLRTLRQVAQLDAAGVIEEQALRVQRKQGEPFALQGLRIINRQRFADLPAETVYELHRSGALALAHAHFISLSNLTDSPLLRSTDTNIPGIEQSGNVSFGSLH